MSEEALSPQAFCTEHLPAQFNRALSEQEQAVDRAQKLLADMQAVTTTLCIDVSGEGGGTFYLNVASGTMTADATPAQPPFLTLLLDPRSFQRVMSEAGDSALGFLGGLAGMAGDIKLTRTRLANLAGVSGTLAFEVTGDDGFALRTHFGEGEPKAEPDTSLAVDGEAYAELRSGGIDPQQAFMSGKIQVGGDMQLAMQLALAVLSPD